MRARILTGVVVVVMAIGLMGAPAHGHQSPADHDHFLTVPGNGSVVQVGPRVCELPHLHWAFHKFHTNVHVGQPPTAISPVFC